jgi:ABC-type nitrate/sulfonate/bicarbonate transport system substrate-binding protein
VTFRSPDLYSELYVLVAHPSQLDKDGPQIRALLRALQQAQTFIAANPQEGKDILQRYTKLDPDVVNGIWGSFDFRLSLTKQLIEDWNAEANWAKSTAKVPPDTAVPDFSSYIDTRFLHDVSPEAVNVQ